MKCLIGLLLFAFTLTSCAQVSFTKENVALDDSLQIAVIQIPEKSSIAASEVFEINGIQYSLKLSSKNALYTKTHELTTANGSYKTYVTSLPLIQIDAPKGIVNEPKRMAQISYAYKDTSLTSFAGIELRGSSSIVFAKKTYDLNFYTDSTGTKNKDFRLAGMRKDDDWILDGLYNEPLRMRSYLSLNLWNELYEPYYLDKEPKAQAGAKAKYSEVFVNGRYKGIFLLQEQVDRKHTQVKKVKGDTIRGEIFQGARYLGASSFDSIPVKKNYLASWGGYDIKYPVTTNRYWDNVYDFTDFVINSDDATFTNGIADRFVIDNAIDYFLYINAVRAPDNLGKNLYLIRYDEGEPYFYAPWDLDGSFGTIFSGKRIATTDDFLTNGLLRRLIDTDADNFIERFQNRWKDLRKDILSDRKILARQSKIYKDLEKNLVFEREAMAWDNFVYEAEGLEYMQDWTKKRLAFLDTYLQGLKK